MLRDHSRPQVKPNGSHLRLDWTRVDWSGRKSRFMRVAPSGRLRPLPPSVSPEQPRLPRRFRHIVRHDDTTNAILYVVALLMLVGVCAVILLGGLLLLG